MNSLTKLTTGSATHIPNNGRSSSCTNTLCNRKISKDQMVRAGNRNSLNRRLLHTCRPIRGWILTKPNLKHISINFFPRPLSVQYFKLGTKYTKLFTLLYQINKKKKKIKFKKKKFLKKK